MLFVFRLFETCLPGAGRASGSFSLACMRTNMSSIRRLSYNESKVNEK